MPPVAARLSAWLVPAHLDLAGAGNAPLELGGDGDDPDTEVTAILGGQPPQGARARVIIGADVWQRTLPSEHDALVSCLVPPGFDVAGFSMQ